MASIFGIRGLCFNLLLVFLIGKNKQQSAIIIAVIDIATTKDNRINT